MGNSPSVDQAMLALDDIQTPKRKERGSISGIKRATPTARSKHFSKTKSCSSHEKGSVATFSLDDYDLKDIQILINELKRDSRGKKLLDEFVDYQTGRSTHKPRLLQLVDRDPCDSEGFDISEIQTGN
jgi:hypothetical protein